MNNSALYFANPIVSCGDEGEDGMVLFNPSNSEVAVINSTGRIIWKFINVPQKFEQIVDHLGIVFQGPTKEQLAKDVEDFVQGLTPDFIHFKNA